MKSQRINSTKALSETKMAFISRLFLKLVVLTAVVIALLFGISELREAVYDYHIKQQKQRQGQINKQD